MEDETLVAIGWDVSITTSESITRFLFEKNNLVARLRLYGLIINVVGVILT
jgi:hypothetical protein